MSQILKGDLESTSMIWILIYYNLVFVLPLIGFIVLRIMMGDKATVIWNRMTALFSHWGKQIIVLSLYVFGPLLIADGVGWFIGLSVTRYWTFQNE